jgi:hypothetical protein
MNKHPQLPLLFKELLKLAIATPSAHHASSMAKQSSEPIHRKATPQAK